MRCVVLDDYQGVALSSADWSALDGRLEVDVRREHLTGTQLVTALQDAEIVVAMRERTPFPADLFDRLPSLRLLVTTGLRNASFDLAAASAHDVTVCGTASVGGTTSELTWALLLALARQIVPEANSVRANGPWQSTLGTRLSEASLGLVGLGRIGAEVAKVGLAFGMRVSAWSQNLTAERAEEVGVRLAPSLPDLMAGSDFASIHLVLSDRTRGIVDAAALAALPRHAYLVNTSRGPLVDRDALVAALTEGRIAGAGLDVFDVEPLPADDVLRSLPNVLATPHLGYVTKESYAVFFEQVVEDIVAFLAGEPVRELTG